MTNWHIVHLFERHYQNHQITLAIISPAGLVPVEKGIGN
jgi:hypothetical protein